MKERLGEGKHTIFQHRKSLLTLSLPWKESGLVFDE